MTRIALRAAALVGLALAGLPALAATPLARGAELAAQDDVVQLGLRHGTRPPAAYFDLRARNPRAFQFSRAWIARNPRLRLVEQAGGRPPEIELRARPVSGGGPARVSDADATSAPSAVLGRRDEPVEGTFRFPLLLGYYSGMAAPPPFTRDRVQEEYFDGPNSRYGTITEYYAEISGGRVTLDGETRDWVRSSLTASQVAGGVSGLVPGSAQVGAFIRDLLAAADANGVDWGQFDNDGPDGVPNSGDDDGWVDLLAVFHPTQGAECGGDGSSNRIWSHKWSLSGWGGGSYATSTPRNGAPGTIRVDDYTIQPIYDCEAQAINEIGVFAHELGHGFGLPDLYCTADSCNHQGVGNWDLMGTGSWGCNSADAARPCHMGAWSKHVLGWLEVDEVPPGADLAVTLEPVRATGRALRVPAQDGSGEYFLLENRTAGGFDQRLIEEGLLVWHVDPTLVDERWPFNAVNNDRNHLGVWLRQADGANHFSNRGDAGDPFPGVTGRTAFHAGSTPRSSTHGGQASGLTLLDLAGAGGDLTFRLLTRFQTVTVRTENESTGGLLTIDGAGRPGTVTSFESAPFETHELEAAAGEPLDPGRRRGFERWLDDDDAPRVRSVQTGLADAEYVARYGDEQVELAVPLTGGQFGVQPGVLVSDPAAPDLWFTAGTTVRLEARPTPGFSFVGWTGALEGQPNPATVVVDAPVSAGAAFELDYELPAEVEVSLEAGTLSSLVFEAPTGTGPYTWSVAGGDLPSGLTLLPDGRVNGHALELGTFPFQLRVFDALGLEAVGGVRMVVGPPAVPMEVLAAPFVQSGNEPTTQQKIVFDRLGNRNGYYDLGDLRTFLRAYPDGVAATSSASGSVVVPLTPVRPGGGR